MRLVVFFLFVIACSADIRVSIDSTGAYNITVNHQVWLRSSRTAIYVDDRWYSTEDNSLPLVNIVEAQGTDPYLGSWNETRITYNLVRNQSTTPIVAHIRDWTIGSFLTFHLETGNQVLNNILTLDIDQIRTSFPSFLVEKLDADDRRGYFTFEGLMAGYEGQHAGIWNSTTNIVRSGLLNGPVVLFDLNQYGEADMMVLSPFSHFMATSLYQRNRQTEASLEYGVMGSITSVPANYMQSFMVFYSPDGVNEGVREWGELMQRAFNRAEDHRLSDITVNYLGYYTNNGGYYYYNPEPGKTYEQTMIDVHQQIKLPFHYLELDSWWYYKGLKDGVANWAARPDVFPDGLAEFHHRVNNIPLAAHNRYWAYDNVYKQNYSFVLDPANSKALPVGNDTFWDDLFLTARNWGLVLYIQDWLSVQTQAFFPTLRDIAVGERWLLSMGAAAEKMGMNIQFCMSFPRHMLQALQIPRVTQARVSGDYGFSLTNPTKSQWNIGITSILADALGIAPFKDVLWSTEMQPGSDYGPSAVESLPDRAILLATLSTGPVAVGDGINYTNSQRIMRCCREDGLILKPDRPLTTINQMISDWATNSYLMPGELYSTTTTINERKFHTLFASAMTRDYSVTPQMIESENGIIWSYDNTQVTSPFDETHPVSVTASKCTSNAICLWYVSPVWQFSDPGNTKYALLGEYNKWTAISRQRFISIATNTEKTRATVVLQGVPSESVSVLVYHSTLQILPVTCVMSTVHGQANLVITPQTVVCA